MHLRKHKTWELYPGCHPTNLGCEHEGRETCNCQYHIINQESGEIYSFDSWKEANAKFMELSGAGADTATTLAAGSNVVYQAYDVTNWEAI